MWNNYFLDIQKKYSMRVSKKEPLIIRLDGRNITKDKNIDLIGNNNSEFIMAIEKAARHFTNKYKCYAIYGSDEISFVCTEPQLVINDMSTEGCQNTNEIISLFSQQFFYYFNSFYKSRVVFWHAKCFSIPKEKTISYIKHRSRVIENVMVIYFLKRNNSDKKNTKLDDKIEMCKKIEGYGELEKIKKGTLYYNGEQIDVEAFLNGENVNITKEKVEEMFSDFE